MMPNCIYEPPKNRKYGLYCAVEQLACTVLSNKGNPNRKLPKFTTKLPNVRKVTELETPTLQVLSRPYNQGTYGRGAGMARRPLTV